MTETIKSIPLEQLHPFPEHPFGVCDDDAMQQTVESIKEYGVLVPAIARPREDGDYEIIAGHRRKHACELAGMKTMLVIVRDLDRNAATIIMVDSNLQRENILPSERAKAYKMKLEAIKRQGARHDLTSVQVGQKLSGQTSREIIAENSPDSSSQILRYIRLNELELELQKLVDDGKIGITPAVEILYLKPDEQKMLIETIDSKQATPSLSQAQRMKRLSQEGKLNDDDESNIQKSEGTSGYNDLKNETGLDIKTLKNKYKSKNSVSEETGDKGKDDSLTKELSKEVFAYLPSQNRNDFALANYDASDIAFFSGDFKNQLDSNTIFKTQELDDSNDSDAVASLTSMKLGGSTDDQKTTFSLMSNFLDELSGWFVNAQYDIVSFSYIMSMFNTRMTRSSDFVKIENGKAKAVKNPTEAEKNKKSYVDRDPSNDLDLKFRTKALNETTLDAEIEYLIVGDRHDKTNANTVWASIYGIRLINNFVAMYSDRDIRITVKSISAEIAAAIAAITFGAGTMLAPVIELAIMMILAATETYMDMVKLVNEGKKIPLIKSKKNLIIKGKDDNEDGFFVSYEDYLMIMLIFTGKTNLLYRTGDLIQMNGYDLRKKYTYVRCANEVSIKPLMISYAFVPDQIKNGHTNRKAFRTLIYQGY